MNNTANDIHKEEVQAEIKRIREKFPQKFTVKELSCDEDSFSPSVRIKDNIYIDDIIKDLQLDTVYKKENDHRDWIEYLQGIKDLSTLQSYYAGAHDNGPDGISTLWDAKDYAENIQQKKRKELEQVTRNLILKYGTTDVNKTFIEKLKEDIEIRQEEMNDFYSGEQRAERYHMNKHAYHEDNDYMNTMFNQNICELIEVKDWIQTNLPLLWAQSHS